MKNLSENLFVSKYRLQLPLEDDTKQYLMENISEEKFKELKEYNIVATTNRNIINNV
ncbi:MAG: hypothetical protein IKN48_12330 [Bacteroidaceae bacterium]|nr:hypothetical protein [Bacteroidaceae bacterium]